MSKTVAIVINTSWNIYNFRLGLLLKLQADGYKIVCIAPKDEYSEKLESLGFAYHNIDINNKGTNPLEDAKLVFAFYKLYKEIAPDVLLQYTIKPNIYGSMAAGMLGIPVISNISGLGTVFLNNSFSSKIARFLYRVALRVPQKIFYQNAHDRELFVKSNLVKAEKTDLLPGSGIDTEKFKPLDNFARDPKKGLRFLFIARLLKDKGLVEYVEAAGTIQNDKNPEFYILGAFYPGNPTAIREDEMKVWEEDGIVKYMGTSDDVRSVIAKADCVVLPSYREGLSRVLLEAASMAKPIITTNVPGCKEVVDNGVNGYLCDVKDAHSLAKQMKKMINLSEDARKEMGRRGREKVSKEFDEKIVIKKYGDTIAFILNG
ncbi:MAG: glycosyltransferase family 4 protein [Sulfurovum sp.]|nr:glycosyltransferase family 4 protein [Sulfurovum sp.]